MSFQVLMPKEGLTMVEGTITEWKVKEGDKFAKDDVVMVFENEKTEIDCEATGSGLIHILAKEGDVVPVGVAVAVIGETINIARGKQKSDNDNTEEEKKKNTEED